MAITEEQSRNAAEFVKGLWRENPVFVALLGLCPTMAVTNSAINAVAMSAATLFVVVGSSLLISLLRNWIPKQVRITMFIVVIATFVTIADFTLHAISLTLYKQLGAFIALIVVNCLILGRQEAFASRNKPFLSVMDALGMAGGFSIALMMLGVIREILGNGSLFGVDLFGASFEPWVVMVLPPGAFITMGLLLLTFNYVRERRARATERRAA